MCLGSNGHYLLADWPKWCRSNSGDSPQSTHLQPTAAELRGLQRRSRGTCGTWADDTCYATFIPVKLPSPRSCISKTSGSDDKGGQEFPFNGEFLSQPGMKASLKLIAGLRNAEDRNHCGLWRLSTFTRRERVLVFWLSFTRQVSAGGDERAEEEGEAIFADLAEFSGLLFRSGECSAAPFDCCLLDLLMYNEPVLL